MSADRIHPTDFQDESPSRPQGRFLLRGPLTHRAALWLAVLLSVVVYVPSLSNGFALDDVRDIVHNTTVHGVEHAGRILTSPYRSDEPKGESPWRPLTSLSFALSWSMGGGSPLPFHALNVAIHAVNTALVVLLLTALGAAPVPALVAGALFAVHPVHVEAVANGVGRGDALMALFVLLGALAYLRAPRRRWVRIAEVGCCYALALTAKENGVALPALLVALTLLAPTSGAGVASSDSAGAEGRWRPRLRRLLDDWLLFAVLAGVLVGYLVLYHHVLGLFVHRDAAPYIVILPASTRITTAVANFTQMARLLLWPADLVADYGPAVIVPATLGSLQFWIGVTVFVGFGTLAALDLKRGGWIALGVVWVALSVAVVSNLAFPVGIWVSERTLYLPSVGVAFLVVGVWRWLERVGTTPRARSSVTAVAGLLVVAGGVRTWSRDASWASTDTVLRTLAREHPESYRAQWWMGQQLVGAGHLDDGLKWLRRATETSPNDLEVRLDYVRALLLAKRSQQAYDAVVHVPPLDPARDVYLTESLIQLGRLDEARAAVRAGLARFPSDPRLAGQARELGVAVGPKGHPGQARPPGRR